MAFGSLGRYENREWGVGGVDRRERERERERGREREEKKKRKQGLLTGKSLEGSANAG